MLVYCDLIANLIKKGLVNEQEDTVSPARISSIGPIKSDLHPEEGYYLSPKKEIEVVWQDGVKYKITVEVIG